MAHITSPGPVPTARKILRELNGSTPAMADVPTQLRQARALELAQLATVDALVVLCRERGLSWAAIAGLLQQSTGAARGRHRRALAAMGEPAAPLG